MTPLTIRQKMTNESIPVPCGKCPDCVKRRQSAWSFRLMQEEKVSDTAYFITLTYDTTHIPITRNGFASLDKKDVQLFMKRLRKAHEEIPMNKPIKYYLVGEYGGKTKRPHYHLIVFNANQALISPAWGKGQVNYGQVTGASIGYTLKYMCKDPKQRIPMHRNDDRLPQFGLMSKRLGLNYLSEQMIRWHMADKNARMYCNIEGGKKIAMPRYFKQKIYTDEERKIIGFHTRQEQIKREEKREKDYEQSNCNAHYERDRAEAVRDAFAKLHASQTDRNKI